MRNRVTAVVVAAVLLAAAYATYQRRRGFIRSFFVPGSGGATAPTLAMPASGSLERAGLPKADRVRVLLIDGLDQETARTLPHLNKLCQGGIDLTVDVGFPTVSLPVQYELWTGLTQQQTGVLFFYKQIPALPTSIPAQVDGSVAIAESHAKIVHSLGFSAVQPSDPARAPNSWSPKTRWRSWFSLGTPSGFEQAASRAVASDAPLAFVHVLRTDSIAHKRGRESWEFRQAAGWADTFLGRLLREDHRVHGSSTRWFVLADHGHRAGGGHGGAEPWIRQVRGCIAGALPARPRPTPGAPLFLIDLSRAIADSLGVALDPRAAGRPLYAALAAPAQPGATLPTPSTGRIAWALLVIVAGVLLTAWGARFRFAALPYWWPFAYLSLIWIELTPSLSTHMIYKANGRIIYMAALPGLCWLALTAGLAMRRRSAVRVAASQLALPTAIAVAALILCGGVAPMLGLAVDNPPLMPRWTAHAGVFMVLFVAGCAVLALAALASVVPFGSGRKRPSESGDRAA